MSQPAPHVADPYRTLGVARAATELEIKAAHRKLAKRFHPDSGGGDTRQFLRVQEAYRVLSDPLLRREWDARHAPGPIRADRGVRPPRPARNRSAAPKAADDAPPAPPRPNQPDPDPRREPRSSRAYTWSATEVPWWEEGVKGGTRRRPRQPVTPPPSDAPNEFDVYNRSSGAAWSMAARAYFRRGDQELPRRGSFHQQGSQPLTAARARTAAEQERRRASASAAAASASAQAVPPTPAGTAGTAGNSGTAGSAGTPGAARAFGTAGTTATRAAPPPPAAPATRQWREQTVQRALQPWPSVGQRVVYALIAWLPFAAAIILAPSVRIDEVMQGALMALTLGMLAAVPRLAYVLAVATLGLLVVGFFFILGLAWLGVALPLSPGLIAAIGGALALGYVATAGMIALGPAGLRPWSRQPQQVSTR